MSEIDAPFDEDATEADYAWAAALIRYDRILALVESAAEDDGEEIDY